MTTQRLPTVVGLALALNVGLFIAAAFPTQTLHDVRQVAYIDAAEWVAVALLFCIVVFWERLPFFSTVGLTKPRLRDWIVVAWFALLALAIWAFLAFNHVALSPKGNQLEQIIGMPLTLRVSSVFTAGVCEELLYRGYVIERFKILTGKVWIGALIGTIFFALGHVPRYGFSLGLLGVAGTGGALSLIYIWRRNLAGCIALHWLIDGVALLILPQFVR